MSTVRRRWRFTGQVQGVGFRYYARAAALHLGLTGWVANNWDGSVTMEAQGDRDALDALVPTIERTNRWARIEDTEVTDLPVKEHEYGFTERSGE
ncbi:acylphosphatase [Gemmiger sp.]